MCALLTCLFRDCSKIMILVVSVFLGCVACYDSLLMNYMVIAKLVSWYPFYYLGYILDFSKIEKTLKSKHVFQCLGGILITYILVTIFARDAHVDASKAAFLYGDASIYPSQSANWMIVKIVYYVTIIVISVSLLSIVPSNKIWGLTVIGRRTMQIYFWHIIVRSLVFATGIQEHICTNSAGLVIWIIISTGITSILSLDFFSFPTSWIIDSVRKR